MFLAVAGMALWFAFPFMFDNGGVAVFQYRCHLEPVSDSRDPCFTDYLPMVEMAAYGLTLILAYPFARFAFSLFAPAPEARGAGWAWCMASKSAAAESYPSLQLAAGLGIVWAMLHAKNFPLALYPYLLYWAAWIAWFVIGIWASWPKAEAD